MPKQAPDCASMDDVRMEIDRIDRDLVDLIAQRWTYIDRAWQLKSRPEDATVSWRIQEVIDKVADRAQEKGVPPALAESLWRQLIGWGIQYEEEKLRNGSK